MSHVVSAAGACCCFTSSVAEALQLLPWQAAPATSNICAAHTAVMQAHSLSEDDVNLACFAMQLCSSNIYQSQDNQQHCSIQ